MGDPTGVGPELIIKALLDQTFDLLSTPVEIVGDPKVLCRAGQIFNCEGSIETEQDNVCRLSFGGNKLIVHSLSHLNINTLIYGQPDATCGKAMADYVEYAIARCLDKTAVGIVTAPINKPPALPPAIPSSSDEVYSCSIK